MSSQVRPVTGFRSFTDPQLVTTASAVIKEMTGNANFPNPTEDLKALATAVDELSAAIAAQVQGGTAATAHKNNKRDTVIDVLVKLAHYVHDNCGNNPAVVLWSGFPLAGTNRAKSPLAKPSITSIDAENSTELTLKVSPIENARCFDVEFAPLGADNTPGEWEKGRIVHRFAFDNGRQPDSGNHLHLPRTGCRYDRLHRLERSGRAYVHLTGASHKEHKSCVSCASLWPFFL